MFFVPVTINGASSIMIDHIVSWIRASVPPSTLRLLRTTCYDNGCDLSVLYEKVECIYRRYLFFYFKSSWRRFRCIILFESRASLVLAPDVFFMKTSNIGKFTRSDWFGVLALLVGYGLLELSVHFAVRL